MEIVCYGVAAQHFLKGSVRVCRTLAPDSMGWAAGCRLDFKRKQGGTLVPENLIPPPAFAV